MSGDINPCDMRTPRSAVEDLQSTAMAVKDMVKQLKGTGMDFECVTNDPFDQDFARSGKGGYPGSQASSSPVGNVSPSAARGYGRGRPQRFRGKRRNRAGRNRGHSSGREGIKHYDDSPHSLPFDQMSEGSESGSDRSYKTRSQRSSPKRVLGGRHSLHEQNSSRRSSGICGEEPDPFKLVSALSEFQIFRASLLQLMEKKEGMLPTQVRNIVSTYNDVFQLSGETVELLPKIALCREHLGENGCLNQTACNELHLCPLYATSWCNNKNCVFGHRWFTDHNKRVLKFFYLNNLSEQDLCKLFRSLTVGSEHLGHLDICKEYNGNGCNKNGCDALHVCQSFVGGHTKCSRSGCRLNHDILTHECCLLLARHGFSTNEAPRDVVVALLAANPTLTLPESSPSEENQTNTEQKTEGKHTSGGQRSEDQQVSKKQVRENEQKGMEKKSKEKQTGKDQNIQASEDASDEIFLSKGSSDSIGSDDAPQRKKGGFKFPKSITSKFHAKDKNTDDNSVREAKPLKTVWSHDLEGDVVIEEICYYSVESTCRNETSGCQRLHSTQHYHWQISEQGSSWLNLHNQQVITLETAFCDPSQDGVLLPRLDPAKLISSIRDLFKVMGRETWQANFEAMILTNTDYSRVIMLRRLHTEKISGKTVDPIKYNWYFLDKNKKWVKYGNVDTAGETNLVSSVTSDDIEKHYCQNPRVPLSFKNASYTYTLDFYAMTQKNQNTNVARPVRRRPEPHIKGEKTKTSASDSDNDGDIPATWDAMQPQERVRLVPLVPNSSEYQCVVNLLNGVGGVGVLNMAGSNFPMAVGGANFPMAVGGAIMPVVGGLGVPYQASRNLNVGRRGNNSNVVKIERIQNPFLWRAFQNKVKEMTTVYGDIKKVDVRHLFHGTSSNVVSSICAENFDWRLHGTSSGQSYGQGTYFSPNSSTSLGYCRGDASGHRHLFVARVAVGSITQGNSSTARPPINSATGSPFDSTGDGVNVIVKYDKQEYYPEYVITMR